MSITLYHCYDARSLRPLWTLEELGLTYELVNMEFPPRYKHPDYRDINPLGTVPAIYTRSYWVGRSLFWALSPYFLVS